MKKAIVTGATGFIGSAFIQELVNQNIDVIALGRKNYEELKFDRKKMLAAAYRIFGKLGFSEGVAGHITCRDPEHPDCFWVNPFGLSFKRLKMSDLVLVNPKNGC